MDKVVEAGSGRNPAPMSSSDDRGELLTKHWYYYKGVVSEPEEWTRKACVFAGSAHPELAREVAHYMGIPLSNAKLSRFQDDEVSVEICDTVRGRDVFIIQPTCRAFPRTSVNDSLMELILFISALRRSSGKTITAVIPYYGYARQDRRINRAPISAADVAHVLTGVGVDRVVSIDLHSGQIQGFFPPSIPVDNLSAVTVGACYFAEQGLQDSVVISPDAGGVPRAKEFITALKSVSARLSGGVESDPKLAMLIKQRSGASKIERMDLIGDVAGLDAIIVDDILDTAGTLCRAAAACKERGARRVFAFCTHGVLSGKAAYTLAEACHAGHLEYIVITNSIPLQPWEDWKKACGDLPTPRLKRLSVAPMIAEAIKRIVSGERLYLTNMSAHLVQALPKL